MVETVIAPREMLGGVSRGFAPLKFDRHFAANPRSSGLHRHREEHDQALA